MELPEVSRAVAAAAAIASSLGLAVDDTMVLNSSNKLTVRLVPCDVVARVALAAHHVASFEIGLAQRLAESGSPVARLDPRAGPRVHERDGFAVTFWTYYPPGSGSEATPASYADALRRLHAGMRELDVPAPGFVERVDHAQQLLATRDRTPALTQPDRELLTDALSSPMRAIAERGRPEQLLHGEPHPGNLLPTTDGLLFIDFETCCRGPVEFDLAHAPEGVAEHYLDVDRDLLRQCRMLVLAMIITWRWDEDDQLPGGRRLRAEWLTELRAMRDRPT